MLMERKQTGSRQMAAEDQSETLMLLDSHVREVYALRYANISGEAVKACQAYLGRDEEKRSKARWVHALKTGSNSSARQTGGHS